MTRNYPVVEGRYLQDILDQPRALRRTVAGLAKSELQDALKKRFSSQDYDSILLTGMGGSFQILHPTYLKLIEAGLPARMAETSELLHFMPRLLNSRTLLIAVSQSGQSAETVRLLEIQNDRPKIVGITNSPSSPLGQKSDVAVLIQAGEEFSVGCKTATTSLAALELVGDMLCGKDPDSTIKTLEQAAPAAEQYLSHWKDHVQALCAELEGTRDLFVTGRGASLAAAGVGGMIMKEAAHFHSEGLSTAALRHGPFEMLGKECFVLVFAGDPAVEALNLALVEDARKVGAKAELIGPSARLDSLRLPAVPKEIRPILEMLPLHMTSQALAALAGREAGKFEHMGKVTTVE
jgi:glutamine---fructose-6-phosphate transaminase (isomerizing)